MNRYISSPMSIEQGNHLWASLSQGLYKSSHKVKTTKNHSRSTQVRENTSKKENKV